MTGVLAENTGRGDVLIRRGVTTEWGVRWERSVDGGVTFELVNMLGWSGVVELRSVMSDLWLSKPVACSDDGSAVVTLTPADTADVVWAGRSQGTWLMNVIDPDGRVERLGDGYFYLEA